MTWISLKRTFQLLAFKLIKRRNVIGFNQINDEIESFYLKQNMVQRFDFDIQHNRKQIWDHFSLTCIINQKSDMDIFKKIVLIILTFHLIKG